MLRDGSIQLWSLPFLAPWYGPTGVGVVSALLSNSGLAHELRHSHVEFGSRLVDVFGQEQAEAIYSYTDVCDMAAGWALRILQAGSPESLPAGLVDELEKKRFPQDVFLGVTEAIGYFAQEDVASLTAIPDIAAFSLTLAQTGSSLLWSYLIKQAFPGTIILFGGSQCSDPMGLSLIDRVPWLDVVARGECDSSIVPLFQRLARREDLNGIPGVAFRNSQGVEIGAPASLESPKVRPTYREYISAYRRRADRFARAPFLYVEGSRGCWWGQRSHCQFCGIHAESIQYREISAEAVHQQIIDTSSEGMVSTIAMSDSILSLTHMKELLPALERTRQRYDLSLFVELKNAFHKEDVEAMARAGVSACQLGVESLSTRLLRAMKKGNRAIEHVQALKWLTECGIAVQYNLLSHVPHELPEDYESAAQVARAIHHLPPPSGLFPIQIHRYSPYHIRWRELGFPEPRPESFYEWVLPASFGDPADFAYVFQGTHPSTTGNTQLNAAREKFSQEISVWAQEYSTSSLIHYRLPSGVVVHRTDARGHLEHFIPAPLDQLYLKLDSVQRFDSLRSLMELSASELETVLTRWRDERLVLNEGDRWLALSIQRRGITPLPRVTSP